MSFRRCFHYESRRLIRTRASADAHLRANEKTIILNEGAITRIDISQLAANSPIEDYFSGATVRPHYSLRLDILVPFVDCPVVRRF